MQVSNVTKTRRRAGAIALTSMLSAAALVAGTISAAHAGATGISVDPNFTYSSSEDVEVTIYDSDSESTYRVGFCSTETFNGIPACSYIALDVEGDDDDLVVEGEVNQVFFNEHYFIDPSTQPLTYDCESTKCQVLVVENHDGSPTPTNFTAAFSFL